MPFKEQPAGFSPEVLWMLDAAMTTLWLKEAAAGASLVHADPALADTLRKTLRRIAKTERQWRPAKSPERETSHG